jgi:muconolactone delta-isomerase
MAIWNALEDLRRRENAKRGYLEVKTPLMWDVELWKRSGHWEKYGENLFRIEQGESLYGLKPMNCPGHMLLFNTQLRSYRDLPIRYAEAAVLHRDEPTGSLQGLTRARQFSQDDAHVFCMEDQIQEEIDAMFDYVDFLYDRFGVRELAHAELATRPDNKLGTDEQWDHTEGVLRRALERIGLRYRVAEGEGAFYGPKIDFFMDDALGRSWQMGTIQLDGQQPDRLGCTYMGSDNREHTPYVIHRALFGSTTVMCGLRAAIERVAATDFTILLEGESGVGKELVARQIHELSRRRNGPFVAINCAALVETLLEAELFGIEERTATGVRGRRGKFEAAENGTLFLDEVSDLLFQSSVTTFAKTSFSIARSVLLRTLSPNLALIMEKVVSTFDRW